MNGNGVYGERAVAVLSCFIDVWLSFGCICMEFLEGGSRKPGIYIMEHKTFGKKKERKHMAQGWTA